MKVLQLLRRGSVIGLSPMDGITDEPFRLTLAKLSPPDLYFTEFVSAEGLTRGGVKLYDQLLYSSVERPIIAQIFGKDPESFYKAAIVVAHLGFDGIDINMGCPAKTVVNHGGGAALIDQPQLASELITSVLKGVGDYCHQKQTIAGIGLNQKTLMVINRNLKYSDYSPSTSLKPSVSVKTRLGIKADTSADWISFLSSQPLDFISLHGRTLKQGYAGQANWEAIASAAKTAHKNNKLLLGNGDIKTRLMGHKYCRQYGVDGCLIGRSALGNPWVFSDHHPSPSDRFSAAILHSQLFAHIFPQRRFEPLRRHLLAYASGLPHARQLRSQLVRVSSLEDLQKLEQDFLNC